MTLSEEQSALLIWMVRTGESSFIFEEMFGPSQSITAGPGGGEEKEREVNPSDVRELEHLGLIATTGHGLRLTNLGKSMYEQLMAEPGKPRRVGF
jgi:ribosomal protein S19E (S16A)